MQEDREVVADFRALYRAHYGFVWHALHRFGTPAGVVEDACQDVFVVAYRRRGDFRGTSVRAWLYGIARRVASNHRRARRRRDARERVPGGGASRQPSREAIVALDRYLAHLRPEDRELFILSEVEGMTGPEIAEARQRNLNTVYTRIRKLRLDLRADLEDPEEIRRCRPRATARSWAVLAPLLRPSAPTLLGLGSAAWGVIVSAGAALAIAPLVAIAVASPEELPVAARATAIGRRAEVPARGGPLLLLEEEPGGSVEAVVVASPPRPEADRVGARPASLAARQRQPPDGARAPDTEAERGPSSLAEENALLRRAARHLRSGDPATTLGITEEHQGRFPTSSFADLRTALRIDALCELGRTSHARVEADAFLRDHPGSPFVERVRKSCGSPQRILEVPDTQEI